MTAYPSRAAVPVLLAVVISSLLAGAAFGKELLQVGAEFPPWELTDHTGKSLSSADLKGQTYLLWFYPKAMTPGCTKEGQELRDRYKEFQERGVVVLGVSFDDPASNARFVREQQFPFRLLSDSKRSLAILVGAADSVSQPTARRISYLVGPNATVLRVYPAVDPEEHAKQVLSDLADLESPTGAEEHGTAQP